MKWAFSKQLLFAAVLTGVLVCCFPMSGGAAVHLIDAFTADSAASWRPIDQSPAPKAADGGIQFSAPFSSKKDRYYWDKPVRFDLSPFAAFDLELTCSNPTALRHLGVYFKSGNGWYIWNKPLATTLRQTVLLLKSDFKTEGQPAGWDKIDAIRISPWKGDAENATLTFHTFSARREPIVILQGTLSCPDAGEKAAAEKVAARVSRMLLDVGIGHGFITEDELLQKGLSDTRVLLLPYNPQPPPALIKTLQQFVAKGGKVGVFYSASTALAAMLHFKLGSYQKAEQPDRWRAIIFDEPDTWGVPSRIWQNSANLFTAVPADKQAKVIAWWHNARNQRQPEAAVLVSPNAFWVTHILMPDDIQPKRDMLLALAAYLDPALWQAAAQYALDHAGRIDSFQNLNATLAALRKSARNSSDPLQVNRWLDEAELLDGQIKTAYASRRYPDVIRLVRRQNRLLVDAYASVQTPKRHEHIGVWDHDGTGLIPGDWNATARLLAGYGVNAVYANLLWGGAAHYPSKHLPATGSLRIYGDQVQAARHATRQYGLQLHAWYVLWKLETASADTIAQMKKAGRLQVTASGTTLNWLSPHHPENRAQVLAVIEELARQYPTLDGIHLDYMRLPDSSSCYAPATRERFQKHIGKTLPNWPADVLSGGTHYTAFRKWRAADITALMKDIRTRLKTVAPQMKLSAAVYGVTAEHGGNIAQDWPAWLSQNLVDYLCPMNYTHEPNQFTTWLRTQLAYPHAKHKIYPGIGVTAAESQLTPDQVIEQINIARDRGTPGVLLFSLTGTLRDDTLPALRKGITRPLP